MAKIVHSDVPSNAPPVADDDAAHYRRIVELSRDLIVIHLRGKVVFVNEAGAEMVGASSPEQCVGMSVLEFLSPSRWGTAVERMESAAAARDSKSPVYEQRLRRLDGTEIDVALRGMPIRYRGEDATPSPVRPGAWVS